MRGHVRIVCLTLRLCGIFSAGLCPLSKSLAGAASRLLFDTVCIGSMSDGGAWSVLKLGRLHEAVKLRLQSDARLYCRHLSINLVSPDVIIKQGLDILVQEGLHMLQPDELVYLGDSSNHPVSRPFIPMDNSE